MSRVPDKDVDDNAQAPEGEPAGRVEFDSRGNGVWRWARDVLESTSVLLKGLDNKDLALEPTQKVPVVPDAERQPNKSGKPQPGAAKKPADPKADAKSDAKAAAKSDAKAAHPAMQRERSRGGSGGGFDPYNSR
jgi:hypothetical protein